MRTRKASGSIDRESAVMVSTKDAADTRFV